MNSKEIEQFVELLYPFLLDRLKKESFFKNNLKMQNAVIKINENDEITAKLAYDNTTFPVQNWSGEELKDKDQVCIGYWVDLKNAVVMKKLN